MKESKDWMPSREQNMVDLCTQWVKILESSANIESAKWNAAECEVLLTKIVAFLDARFAYGNNNSTSMRIIKDEAKDEAIKAMREFANVSIRYNRNMEEAEKQLMGIRKRDTAPTVHPRPSSQPNTMVENTVNHFEHMIKAVNRDNGTMARPADAYGVRYAWKVGGEQPVSGADLPRTKFSRKTNLVVQHSEADKGKLAWYAACYENAKGDTGTWSPVVESYIA